MWPCRAITIVCLAVCFQPACGPPVAVENLRASKHGHDWPRFLGPDLDGKSKETAIELHWPSAGPPLRWHRPIGQGYAGPATSRGRLFVFDRHGGMARLSCLNSETGEELWRSEYPTDYEDLYGFSNGPRATPVVDGDSVYTFGVEGRLRCLRVTDGELLWEVDTAETFGVVQNFFGVGSTPIVEKDLLIVSIGGSPPDSPSILRGKVVGNGSGIVAFGKRQGEVRYRTTDELASYASPVVATVGGRRRGFAFMRGGLVGFDPATGGADFHFPWRARKLESVNASTPLVVGDTLLLSESYGPGSVLLNVARPVPEVIWQDTPGDHALETHWMTPIHDRGIVYASSGAGSGDAELRAVDLLTRKIRWSQPGLGRSTLLWVANHLVVLTERGRLLVVEATPLGYRVVSETTPRLPGSDADPLIRHPAWNAPILSHGLLYVRGKDRLACFDLNKTRPRGDR